MNQYKCRPIDVYFYNMFSFTTYRQIMLIDWGNAIKLLFYIYVLQISESEASFPKKNWNEDVIAITKTEYDNPSYKLRSNFNGLPIIVSTDVNDLFITFTSGSKKSRIFMKRGFRVIVQKDGKWFYCTFKLTVCWNSLLCMATELLHIISAVASFSSIFELGTSSTRTAE